MKQSTLLFNKAALVLARAPAPSVAFFLYMQSSNDRSSCGSGHVTSPDASPLRPANRAAAAGALFDRFRYSGDE